MQKYQDFVIYKGRGVAGASVLVTTAAGATATIYSDNGSTTQANPMTTGVDGDFAFYAADGRYNIDISGTGFTTRTISDVLLEDPADGSSALADTDGAGLVGYSTSEAYASATVGNELRKIGTKDLGTLAAGGTIDVNPNKTFIGHSGGTTDFRAWADKVTANGANAIAQVNVRNTQLELTSTGGVTFAYGTQGYIRAGLAGAGAVNVTTARGFEHHIANEGTGEINDAFNFLAGDIDLIDGTGNINSAHGFYCQNQGHATRVPTRAVGFGCADFTAGAARTAAFYSEMSSGTNKYTLYAGAAAPSVHPGLVSVGSSTDPVDALEVRGGYLKASADATFHATGSYHELRSANGTFAAFVSNKNASTPEGLRIIFPAAAPNNTTQHFLYFDDSSTVRFKVFSNGNVVNSNNSYGAVSDAKLKRDVRDAGSQWADIKAIRFRKYKLIADGEDAKEQLGVIAQELEQVSPGLVSESPDETGTTKSVSYSVLYLKAVKALQEAMSRIEALEADVQAMKGQQ